MQLTWYTNLNGNQPIQKDPYDSMFYILILKIFKNDFNCQYPEAYIANTEVDIIKQKWRENGVLYFASYR